MTQTERQTVTCAVLVYQAGIANVFSVTDTWDGGTGTTEGRNAQRLLQHSFTACEWYARGLVAAGVKVTSMQCNMAGDVADRVWSMDLDAAPFSREFRPVFGNGGGDTEVTE